jgi:DNA-binding transcriptional MerR regulator
MEKFKAIPQGYMTVGELAKKMGVTVRTLQYYDKEGLLSPSAESDGGFRLYTDKDMVQLHQILTLKYVGFSLADIKTRLTSIETPADMANALAEHAIAIRKKVEALSESLSAIEALREEVMQMQSVDFQKYAAIVVNLQLGNDFYGLVKHLDNDTIDELSGRFTIDEAKTTIDSMNHMLNRAMQFYKEGVAPDSDEGQAMAKEFWDMTVATAGGDMSLLMTLADKAIESNELGEKQLLANKFLEPALEIYFTRNNYNPFEEKEKSQ